MTNYYELLKLPESITCEEIEFAFERFKTDLGKFSPGIQISDPELRLRQPELWDAYVLLLDPAKRIEYDEALERDRIHLEYERKNKLIQSEGENKSSNKANFIFLIIVSAVFGLYFLVAKLHEEPYMPPKWRTHYITNEVKVLLPAPIDTNINILPPFMMHYIKSKACCKSELSDGFSVTIAKFETIERFKISFKDVSYIVNNDMGSHLAIQYPDSTTFTMTIHDYRAFVRKGNYGFEGSLRAFENYSLVKDNFAIKVIVSYVPGNELHKKYSEIVFNSLVQ